MGGLRRWTPSPYPGRQALSRGAYELPGVRQPILSPWSYYSWVFGRPAAPPSHAVRFLHHWAPWSYLGRSREYHCCGIIPSISLVSCTEAGGESQERGKVSGARPLTRLTIVGTRLAPWSLWYGLVTRSLTVSIVTLKLRATTIPFWWGRCRARSVITDQPVSPQRSSAGDPVRV
jgi:hypothetical protein